MIELIAENAVVRALLLVALFGIVAAAAYFIVLEISARQMTRRRLVDQGPDTGDRPNAPGSLRSDQGGGAWLRLVNAIEKSGLSLVDTKDDALRQRLIAAGFTAAYAPRVYTVLRLALVITLPILVLVFFWLTGSRPGIGKLY